MMRQTSNEIRQRLLRLRNADLRRLQGEALAELLTADAARNHFGLSFRADAAGALHIYQHVSFALETAARRPECPAGSFAAFLMRVGGGPGMRALPAAIQALQAASNSGMRGDLRRLEKNLSPSQRAEVKRGEAIHLDTTAELRAFTEWRSPENS